jgi:DNA mismatch repair protein MutS
MHYLQETQKANIPHIKRITPFDTSEYMVLDSSTKRNLEVTSSLSGQSEGTLFAVLDRTQTAMGGRMLKAWINRPLKKLGPIRERLSAIQEFHGTANVRKRLRQDLEHIGDLERLVARIATGRATPRELKHLEKSLGWIPQIKEEMSPLVSPLVKTLSTNLDPLGDLVALLRDAIADDPPLTLADGGVIRKGYQNDLDELREFAHSGKEWIARLQTQERERTGIPSLKVGYNNVFGYYIEITNTHKDKVPAEYIRKQTLTNAERYITPELKEYEDKVLHAEEKILALETKIFNDVRTSVAEHASVILEDARILATLDCFIALADAAIENSYSCPEVDDSQVLEIKEGRHPVIERLLPPGERYTANDTVMNTEDDQILIVTGPNMSGKSSYLRQVGLIVLLAQVGSFVPAARAKIGLVDRIYTRVGASDNIASGESTFLVEMHEAATIVNTATNKSLILLDEVGRGTSTFDGISIAWALTEYLHTRIGAKTLFATHYHELNELADIFPRIRNYKVDVREYGDKVIFLHKVVAGFADHSYGIQVAQMAGLPEEITERAKRILKNLEDSELNVYSSGKQIKGRIPPPDIQMTLFEMKDERLREDIRKLEVEKMTPLEALQRLAELKKRVEGE